MIGAAPWGAFLVGLLSIGGILAALELTVRFLRGGSRVAAGEDFG